MKRRNKVHKKINTQKIGENQKKHKEEYKNKDGMISFVSFFLQNKI